MDCEFQMSIGAVKNAIRVIPIGIPRSLCVCVLYREEKIRHINSHKHTRVVVVVVVDRCLVWCSLYRSKCNRDTHTKFTLCELSLTGKGF